MPVAGAIQVTIAELLRQRNYRRRAAAHPMTGPQKEESRVEDAGATGA